MLISSNRYVIIPLSKAMYLLFDPNISQWEPLILEFWTAKFNGKVCFQMRYEYRKPLDFGNENVAAEIMQLDSEPKLI